MHKTIALFSHKGGVSKTTTAFNLGWKLAEHNKRVIIVDTDPQCNLTGLVVDFGKDNDLEAFYNAHPNQNIYAGLKPAFESQPKPIEAVPCVEVRDRNNLFLLPGHVNLSEYEVTLGMAQEISFSIQALRNLPGAINYLISKTADLYNADYVILDMSPSLGAINQNLLMISDYFIIPTAPDYFSSMAIDSLANVLPRWIEWARKAFSSEVLKNAAYPFPEPKLKFLGTIIQKYRPRKGKATIGFQTWIDEINDRVVNKLFLNLQKCGLTLKNEKYAANGLVKDKYCLVQVPDFNSLIAVSQNYATPIFALTDKMFDHAGAVLEQDRETREQFNTIFEGLTTKIISLTSNE